MKNFKLLMILMLALGMTFASCSKDDDDDTNPVDLTPTISFKGGNGYISEDATVLTEENFTIGINAYENSESGKNLRSVKFTVTSNNVIILEEDSTFNEAAYTWDYTFSLADAGDAVFKFEVTDKDELTSSVSLTMTAKDPVTTTDLGDAVDFEWLREGVNAATGLDAYGLKWTKSLKTAYAVIEKDAATKMVSLTAEDWVNFTTVEDLTAAIEAGEDLADYRGVHLDAGQTYDEVLGVIYNDEYYMIHITESEISTGAAGTTAKIMGQSKK